MEFTFSVVREIIIVFGQTISTEGIKASRIDNSLIVGASFIAGTSRIIPVFFNESVIRFGLVGQEGNNIVLVNNMIGVGNNSLQIVHQFNISDLRRTIQIEIVDNNSPFDEI